MRKPAISISDLQKYADRLPNLVRGQRIPGYYNFAVSEPLDYHVNAYTTRRMDMPSFAKITFESRETRVNGVQAVAWYYHDVLVKVQV